MEYKGIDVSSYQGEIDWAKAAQSGVQFAFIRLGCVGYEGDFFEGADPCFARNMQGAKAAGLPVGAYIYSYCRSPDAARRAVAAAAGLLRPYRLDLPLAWDVEDAATYAGLGRAATTAITAAALAAMRAEGYAPMLYTYTSFANQYLQMDALAAYDLWLADYRGYMGIAGAQIWQYTSSGKIPGIEGRVDCNICYKGYPALDSGTEKGGKEGMMQFVEVFGEKNCQCFSRPDVNAVDTSYRNGRLESGACYPLMADAGEDAQGYRWLRVYAGGAVRYTVLLADRCRVAALSAGDAVKAVLAQGCPAGAGGEEAQRLRAELEEAQKRAERLQAEAAQARANAEKTAALANAYMGQITAARAALGA